MSGDLSRLAHFLETSEVIEEEDNTTTISIEQRNKNYNNYNYELSVTDYRNACQVLCTEIQSYKRLLFRAENFSPQMIYKSVKEIQMFCPEESFEIKKCA
mmetsp:Transcript_11573/g.21376  ORF Transcript_11573/g.21376 Transcript_11573/m.21376 type:complete len:100 (+) Transcript_11573:737-1036(+)